MIQKKILIKCKKEKNHKIEIYKIINFIDKYVFIINWLHSLPKLLCTRLIIAGIFFPGYYARFI